MAFADLGLTEDEFFRLPPMRTYMMQLHEVRKNERAWEQTREVVAMIHNMAGKISKKSLQPKDIKMLSFDDFEPEYPEWTQEEALEFIKKMTGK